MVLCFGPTTTAGSAKFATNSSLLRATVGHWDFLLSYRNEPTDTGGLGKLRGPRNAMMLTTSHCALSRGEFTKRPTTHTEEILSLPSDDGQLEISSRLSLFPF